MKRWEANIYMKCIAILAFGIIAAVFLMTLPVSAKKAVFTDDSSVGEYFIDQTDESPENALFDANSAMPCVDGESFKKWMETYEQETGEEVEVEQREESSGEVSECTALQTVSASETEEIQESVPSASVFYSINGETLNPDIQAYMYQRLSDHHIEWFMPYAIMMAYQESHFDCTAVNQNNGIDCGLFQFRAPYYEGQDIFNPYEQIDIFTQQMANRANAGCDVYEMISRHHQSDYGAYSHEYVSAVMQHKNNLREVE